VTQKKHPAQNPDLAPRYFHLIQTMKQHLGDHTHKDEHGVEKCVTRWLIKQNQIDINREQTNSSHSMTVWKIPQFWQGIFVLMWHFQQFYKWRF